MKRCNVMDCTNKEEATYMFVLDGPIGYNDGIETLRCTSHMVENIRDRSLTNSELATLQKI